MDLIKQLGELALGSRLKRLSDQIMRDGAEVYRQNGIDFEPRWFPVFYTLLQSESMAVTEIAQEIGVKHPTVSQTLREMEKKGLVTSSQCSEDGRKRLISLTQKARDMQPRMEKLWSDISNAVHEMLVSHNHNILCAIESFELGFDQRGFLERVSEQTQARQMDNIEIIPYTPELKEDFQKISLEWIEKYFIVESEDQSVLDHPEKIMEGGGTILFARYAGEIAGTCALINLGEGVFELAKMGVYEKFQGKQIGKKLGLAIVDEARRRNGKKLILESNKKLTPALVLYEKLGFRANHESHDQSLYERCDIQMEMDLTHAEF